MRNRLLLLLLPLFLLGSRPDFKQGVNLYNQGATWEALRIFAELAETDPATNPQVSAAAYMRIRCYDKLGFGQRALMLARDFQVKYPESSYGDDLQLLLSEIYLHRGDAREAAWYAARTAVISDDKKIRKAARQYAERLIGSVCSLEDVQALAGRSIDRTGQFVALLAAERLLQEGRQGASIDILFNLRPYIRDDDLRHKAINLFERMQSGQVDTLHIAVVLPLTGALEDIGKPIRDGIRYAAMSYMDSVDQVVQLHVFDNAGELSESIRIARLVRDDPRIMAQIGPLTNENIKGSAAVLEGRRIPLIAPTATEDDLTNLSESIFQFRATRQRKAISLADYAVRTLGLQTFAVIAPSTEYGQQLADNFARRVDELGGQIQYQGWYVGEPTDLSKVHFRRIREQGLEELYQKMQADSLRLDSLMSGLIETGDSVNVYAKMLQPILRKSKPTRSDSLKVRLSHIDAIFFPIHRGSIPYIASQVAHNNIVTHVLGDENWLDRKALRKNARYLPQLTLVTGDKLGFHKLQQGFSDEYASLFAHAPQQYDLLGYDVMGMTLDACRYAGGSGSTLWDVLVHSPSYSGCVHQVQWGGDTRRENNLVFLMDYRDASFHLTGYYDNSGFFSMDSLATEESSAGK